MIAETLNAVPQAVSYADVQLDRLVDLLDEEFNALKEQDLDAFEELLNEKIQILADLCQ
jgi:flagellar biosynthesis/type III secretory pathway chaperone